jgi:hypothetical protein
MTPLTGIGSFDYNYSPRMATTSMLMGMGMNVYAKRQPLPAVSTRERDISRASGKVTIAFPFDMQSKGER